jgi:DNA polymerase/3'-5' exonuclease PolX
MSHELIASLLKLPGIGIPRANKLIKMGLKSVKDLKREPYISELTDETKLYLKFDVMEEIPWEFADKFVKTIPEYFLVLGSYRRKRPIVHDIDLFTTKHLSEADRDFQNGKGYKVVGKFVDGSVRIAYIVKFQSRYMKVDIFHAPEEELPAAILHWTGSVRWNIRCRFQAKRKGYLLNEKGLFDRKTNRRIPVKSEEEILEKIGIAWKPPEEREK